MLSFTTPTVIFYPSERRSLFQISKKTKHITHPQPTSDKHTMRFQITTTTLLLLLAALLTLTHATPITRANLDDIERRWSQGESEVGPGPCNPNLAGCYIQAWIRSLRGKWPGRVRACCCLLPPYTRTRTRITQSTLPFSRELMESSPQSTQPTPTGTPHPHGPSRGTRSKKYHGTSGARLCGIRNAGEVAVR